MCLSIRHPPTRPRPGGAEPQFSEKSVAPIKSRIATWDHLLDQLDEHLAEQPDGTEPEG